MSRHTHNFAMHLALLIPYHHYTNVNLFHSQTNLQINLMSQNMFLMVHIYNPHCSRLMIYPGRQNLVQKKQKKKLQNKSSRFVLWLLMDYMCVCVCVCVCVGFCGFQLDKKFVNVFCSFLVHFFLLSLFRFFIPRPGRGDHEVVGRVVNQLFFSLPPSPTSSVLPHGGEN